jgi:hypothetical protein
MFGGALAELEDLDYSGLLAAVKQFEMLRREAEASLAAAINIVRRTEVFRCDGHRSTRGFVKALTKCSDTEAAHLIALGDLLHDIPECGEQLVTGGVGVGQMRELVRLKQNPRCGDRLPDSAELLLGHAKALPFADFRRCARHWLKLNDPDGSFRERDVNIRARTASVLGDEDGLHVKTSGGTAGDAAEMVEIFGRFCQAEFLTDWDGAVAAHGDAACKTHMARTDSQRRFDAFLAIFRTAAGAPLDVRVPEVVVNYVIDQHTYENYVARLTGFAPPVKGEHATAASWAHRWRNHRAQIARNAADRTGNSGSADKGQSEVEAASGLSTPGRSSAEAPPPGTTVAPGVAEPRPDGWSGVPPLSGSEPTSSVGQTSPTGSPTDSPSSGDTVLAGAAEPWLDTWRSPLPPSDRPPDATRSDDWLDFVDRPIAPTIDPAKRRCETITGNLMQADEILYRMLIGHVRRVVYDSSGTVIDLGRKRRLFTGSAREAIMLNATRCFWPGCDMPVTRCEADHVQPWTDNGHTSPANGTPACSHHNRIKNHGYKVRRGNDGQWHTYRADGTELTEPNAA